MNLKQIVHDNNFVRIYYIFLFILSVPYSLFKLTNTINLYKKLFILTSSKTKAFCGAIFSYGYNYIAYKNGMKILNEQYINDNIKIINLDKDWNGLIVSQHFGASHFLHKILAQRNYNLIYVRGDDQVKKDFKQYKVLYSKQFVFKDVKDIIFLTKKLYEKQNIVYVALDGKINSKEIEVCNYNILYSDTFLKIAFRKNISIKFISSFIMLNGKIEIIADEYTYNNQEIDLETFLENFKNYYISKYLENITKYPYLLRHLKFKEL